MTYMIGLIGMGLGFLGTGFAGTNVALLVLFNALKGIGQVVLGRILALGGYDGTATVQSEAAKAAISFIYNWLPIAMIVVTFLIMLTYKLDKELPKIQKEL